MQGIGIACIIDRQQHRKYRSCIAIRAIGCADESLMKLHQPAAEVKTDTCTPLEYTCLPTRKLEITVEEFVKFILGQSGTIVGDTNLDKALGMKLRSPRVTSSCFLPCDGVEIQHDVTSRRNILDGIADKIVDDLLDLVLIDPLYERLFKAMRGERDVLLTGLELERLKHIADHLHEVEALHFKPKRIILEFVEVHHLVDQAQHTIHTALHDGQRVVRLGRQALVIDQLSEWSGNDGERCTEFVRHVGKEAHVHRVDALLVLVLTFGLQSGPAFQTKALHRGKEIPDQHKADKCIQQLCPPGEPQGR